MSATRYGDNGIQEKVWEEYFGNINLAFDAFGHEIKRNEYGLSGDTAWDIDHIWPKNPSTARRRGSDYYKNLQPLCVDCNEEKSNDMSGVCFDQSFTIESAGTIRSDDGEERMIGRMTVEDEVVTLY